MGLEYRRQIEVVSTVSAGSLALLEDGFESTTVKWSAESLGGLAGGLYTSSAYNGNNSYRMQTRSAGATNNDYQGIVRYVGLSSKPRINFVARTQNMGVNTDAGREMYQFLVEGNLSNTTYEIVIDSVNRQLLYRNASNVLVAVPNFTTPGFADIFKRVEIQINIVTKKIEYVMIGDRKADMNTLTPYTVVTATNLSDMAVRIRAQQDQAVGGVGTDLRVDDIVITTPD